MTFSRGTVTLLVGTKRGLFLFSSRDRRTWTSEGQILETSRVFNAILDQRGPSPRIFACDNGDVFGSAVKYSDDFGETWLVPKRGISFPAESGRSIENLWIVQPGRDAEPDVVYAGADPASLWVSRDRGETWDLVDGLESHPTRERWQPGLGGLCLHSIVPDHSSPDRMWIAISAVGVFRTEDGGKTWTPRNVGVPARHMPEVYPEFGQCVHRLVQHPSRPDVLYQQNHWGLFSSSDAAESWDDIRANLPSFFGFPMAIDRGNPDTLFSVVETAPDAGRHNVGDRFTVYRTDDAGRSWSFLTNGLPAGPHVKLNVLRHALCADASDPVGIYVGTTTGNLFASADRGESWSAVADFMPPIFSVNVATMG